MKRFLRLIPLFFLLPAASCAHTAMTPEPAVGIPPATVYADARPRTVHIIPFYNFGKSGYNAVSAAGGRGGLAGDESALYGATALGGSSTCTTPFDTTSNTGCGIAYRLVPNPGKSTYKIKILHTFKGGADGAASFSTLLLTKSGDLYGTTFYGGTYNGGTLFKLHPVSTGYTESVVYSFGNGQDGAYPAAGVIEVNGMLFGTTVGGGTHSNQLFCKHYGGSPNGTCGTVYALNPATGSERVLHSFGGILDGENPYAALVNVAGTLYGTTDLGGSNTSCGTVYSIGTDGSNETVVYNFLNAPDGCNPFGSLINVGGTLYGTTCCGGGNFCPNHCEGTLYSVDISTGRETVLHEFGKPQDEDGSEPLAGLTYVNGALYGTANIGGIPSCNYPFGCGTIFSLALSSSKYKTLYEFDGADDGAQPTDTLLLSHAALYGTTLVGGKKGLGTADKLPLP